MDDRGWIKWLDDGDRQFANFREAAQYWERKALILVAKVVLVFAAFAAFMAVAFLVIRLGGP